MNLPGPKEMSELRDFDEPFCLTIYCPYDAPTSTGRPSRIALKNLLGEAETALLSSGVQPRDVRKTLRPARLLLDSREFWPPQYGSLAIFSHPGLFRYYHIPAQSGHVPYMLSVSKGFNLNPLSRIMRSNRHYYILALGHKNVRLYEGDCYGLAPVHLRDLPADMERLLRIDEYPRSFETHTVAPADRRKRSQAPHGQYNVRQTDKTMLVEFFRRIDKRLHSFLSDKRAPLIIAGVKYLQPLYRQVNTYPELLPIAITGNAERESMDSIRRKACGALESASHPASSARRPGPCVQA